MSLPAGPRGPALAQTLRWFRDPVAFLEGCRSRHGDVFTVRFLGMGDLVYVTDPALIKEVFAADTAMLHAGEANEVLEPVLGRNSLLLLDEQRHLRERKLLLPAFHGESVRRYRELIAEIAGQELDSWPRGEPFAIRPHLQRITLEVILRAVFGMAEGDRLDRLRVQIPRLLDWSNAMLWMQSLRPLAGRFGPWRRFEQVRGRVDAAILEEISRRRSEPGLEEREDVLSMLLRARDEDGGSMSDGELRDELVTLLVAGHETTTTGLAWAIERLVRTPAALARLTAEVDAGESAYLDATIKETLRSRAVVVDVARLVKAPFRLAGYELPPGSYVCPAIAVVQRRADLYPNPERFFPERFLDGQPDSYSWIPFGGGPRRCIGAAFATEEMRAVLRTVLQRLELRAADPAPERAKVKGVTLVPARGGVVIARERAPGSAGRAVEQPLGVAAQP